MLNCASCGCERRNLLAGFPCSHRNVTLLSSATKFQLLLRRSHLSWQQYVLSLSFFFQLTIADMLGHPWTAALSCTHIQSTIEPHNTFIDDFRHYKDKIYTFLHKIHNGTFCTTNDILQEMQVGLDSLLSIVVDLKGNMWLIAVARSVTHKR